MINLLTILVRLMECVVLSSISMLLVSSIIYLRLFNMLLYTLKMFVPILTVRFEDQFIVLDCNLHGYLILLTISLFSSSTRRRGRLQIG